MEGLGTGARTCLQLLTRRALDCASSFSPKPQNVNSGCAEEGPDNQQSEADQGAPDPHLGKAFDHQVHRQQETEYTDDGQVAGAASSSGVPSGVAHGGLQCLTFDVSRGPKGAKRPLGRPLGGGIRRLGHYELWAYGYTS